MRIEGCILIAKYLEKRRQELFCERQINFYQTVQRFSSLRFSSLFTLNGLLIEEAVNRRGFVCVCFGFAFLLLLTPKLVPNIDELCV